MLLFGLFIVSIISISENHFCFRKSLFQLMGTAFVYLSFRFERRVKPVVLVRIKTIGRHLEVNEIFSGIRFTRRLVGTNYSEWLGFVQSLISFFHKDSSDIVPLLQCCYKNGPTKFCVNRPSNLPYNLQVNKEFIIQKPRFQGTHFLILMSNFLP